MTIGSLVRMADGQWSQVGIVVRQIPGWAEYQVIRWQDGQTSRIEKNRLELVV